MRLAAGSRLLILNLLALALAPSVMPRALVLLVGQSSPATEDSTAQADRTHESLPATVEEARIRARLLHETIHGALQVIHRDFFREEDRLRIPSRSLEDVFSELTRQYSVKLNWIAVDLKAMTVDNEPETKFEIEAARALKAGEEEFESSSEQEYRFAGRIRLSATCLSCHASQRSSNEDQTAGLVITMPLK